MRQLFGDVDEKTVEAKVTLESYVRSTTEKAIAQARKKIADQEAEYERKRLDWLDEESPKETTVVKNKKNKKKSKKWFHSLVYFLKN